MKKPNLNKLRQVKEYTIAKKVTRNDRQVLNDQGGLYYADDNTNVNENPNNKLLKDSEVLYTYLKIRNRIEKLLLGIKQDVKYIEDTIAKLNLIIHKEDE